MNKSFIKNLGIVLILSSPIFSAVSCSNKTSYSTIWKLKSENVFFNANQNEMKNDGKTSINIVDHIDSIQAPEVIRVSKNGYNIFDDIKIITNDNLTYVSGSSNVAFTSDNNNWSINNFGTISLKENSRANIELTIKNKDNSVVKSKFCLIHREQETNPNKVIDIESSGLNVTGLNVGTTSVNNFTKGISVDGKNYESLNFIYSDSTNDPTKRVNIFANTFLNNTIDKMIKVDPTHEKIGLLFYLGDAYQDKEFWVRTVWNSDRFQDGVSANQNNKNDVYPYNLPNIDFNAGTGTNPYHAHKGWNLFQIDRPIDTLSKPDNYLSLIRIIQLKNSVPNGVDGNTVSLCGVFQSDVEMNLKNLLPLIAKP